MNTSKTKVLIFPIIALFVFLMLIFGAAYAYLSGTISMNTSNYQVILPTQTSLICTKTDCNVTITPAMMTSGNVSSSAKANSTCYVDCTCSGTPGASCNYNVTLYEATSEYIPSSGLGANNEFTVKVTNPTGCTSQNASSSEKQTNTINGKVVSQCSLTVPAGGSVSANVSAEFKWYNLNLNQDAHSTRSYSYFLSNDYELPSEYQQVEYIQTSGSQFINTQYYITSSNVRVYTKVYSASPPSSEQDIVSNQDNSTGRFVIGFYTQKVFGYSRSGSATDINTYSSAYTSATTFYIDMLYDYASRTKTMIVNGEKTTQTQNATIANSTSPVTLFKNASSSTLYFTGRMYYFKLYDNNKIELYLIPCYRKSDNVIGMYDIIHDNFYINEGSGSFTKGNNI